MENSFSECQLYYGHLMDTYHHADIVFGVIFALLYGVIEHYIHEGIESTQDAGDSATAIQFEHHALVHVPKKEYLREFWNTFIHVQ